MPPNVEEEEAAKAAASTRAAAAAAAAVVSLLAGIFCVLVSTRHPRLAPAAPSSSSSPRISPHARPFQCSFLERMNFDTSRCCVNHSQEQRGRGECRSRFSLWQLMRLAKRKAKICWLNLGPIQVGPLLAPNHSYHYHYLIWNTQTSASFIILV